MSKDQAFEKAFGRSAEVQIAVPGRVNLIGEHIDYTGGTVLPTVIDRELRIHLAPNKDRVRIVSTSFGEMVDRPVDAPIQGEWFDYILAAHRRAVRLGLAEGGADILVNSNIPHGAGVSSSAALLVAVLLAHAERSGHDVSRPQIAKWAQDVEREDIGVPCGIMDQMAVAVGQRGFALALDTRDCSFEQIPIPDPICFPVFHSGIRRGLVDGQYAERFASVAEGKAFFGEDHLSLIDESSVSAAVGLSERTRRRVRHVVTEHRRTLLAIEALKAGEAETFGALMSDSHRSMRDDFDLVPDAMDAMTSHACALGAYGSRLTGGGFGGCFVSCVAREMLPEWKAEMMSKFPQIAAI